MLRAADCDLVALQEVSALQGASLERELGDAYPHRVIQGEGVAGKALLSRYPVVEHEALLFGCGRPHLRARVDVSGRRLQVIVAHVPLEHALFYILGPAAGEVDALAQRATNYAPSLLVGDFNKTPFSLLHRRVRRHGLEDAFQKAGRGFGFTFPVFGRYLGLPLPPLVRIDYVWHTPDLRVLSCRPGPDGGSDHLPVQVELAL